LTQKIENILHSQIRFSGLPAIEKTALSGGRFSTVADQPAGTGAEDQVVHILSWDGIRWNRLGLFALRHSYDLLCERFIDHYMPKPLRNVPDFSAGIKKKVLQVLLAKYLDGAARLQ